MGKFRKMLAGVLSAVMVLSTMTVTAFAETSTTTPATIDTTKTGSITIHKYEYNESGGEAGTGETTDVNKVPSDAKALEGAGFTIYKVADIDDLAKYYNANPESLPSVDDYLTDGEINASKVLETKSEVKTDNAGIAKFDNLALGFYVVVETTTPDKVTTPVKPFIVSVPMTTKDGDNWLYDVHVYPKNKTTYGGVTLEKTGKDGTKLEGVTFILQKQNGSSWVNVTKNENTGDDLTLKTDKDGRITVEGLSQGKYRFIETDRGTNNGYIMDGATVYEFTVTADGKIVYDGKTENNIIITVKNEKPDMTKQVKERDKDNWKQDADYNVGDMVPYKITIDVPSNITNLKEFTLTDTPTNLDDKEVSLQCEGSDVDLNAYSVAKEGEHGFKITFTTENMASYAGKQIVVTYNAELLGGAVTTINGNQNTAKLEYSNKILPGQDDKDNPNRPENPDIKPGKDSIEDSAVVYTFKLQILKKAEKADGTPLQDVEFDLYKEVSKETINAITGAKAKNVGLDSEKYWLKINTDPLKTDENGEVSQSGLANGTYYLVETKTNKNYNLLKEPVKVELNIVYTTTTKTEWVTDENGVKTLVKNEITKTEFKEGSDTSTGTHTETIINKKGFTLPITGGMGTVLFSIAGFALMAGAAFVLLKGRRKDA
ncbi:SpaH/EbpB family LPXTG-anchored major pilin [Mediterraneibacter faecis]|uniref:SpaH/EbpB family LPXTG-anchored major pilin n=1 Tax=Mediterraneibacter faecis TaxID=592978 RepID=UPI0032C149CF